MAEEGDGDAAAATVNLAGDDAAVITDENKGLIASRPGWLPFSVLPEVDADAPPLRRAEPTAAAGADASERSPIVCGGDNLVDKPFPPLPPPLLLLFLSQARVVVDEARDRCIRAAERNREERERSRGKRESPEKERERVMSNGKL